MLGASGGGLKTLSVEFCSSLLQSPHLLNTRLFLASDAWCVRRSVCRVLELLMRPLGQLKEGIRVSAAAFSRVHILKATRDGLGGTELGSVDGCLVREEVCRVLELLMRPLGQLKEGIRVSAAFSRVHSPEVCTGLGNRP